MAGIGIIPNQPGCRHGSTRYRCYNVVSRCPSYEVYQDRKTYDAVFHQRSPKLQKLGVAPVQLLDTSDLHLLEGWQHFDHITVTNWYLSKKLAEQGVTKPISVLPDILTVPEPLMEPPEWEEKEDALVIGFFGQWNPEIPPLLSEILGTLDFPYELRILSHPRGPYKELWRTSFKKARYFDWHWSHVFEVIRGFHVTLLPSPVTEFFRCKGNNRAVLSIACGVPVVAASLPMNEAVTTGVEGIAPRDYHRWLSLVRDPDNRRYFAERQQKMIGPFLPESVSNLWELFAKEIA